MEVPPGLAVNGEAIDCGSISGVGDTMAFVILLPLVKRQTVSASE
jgi:hypothetical protein